jgi:hypothetical protein
VFVCAYIGLGGLGVRSAAEKPSFPFGFGNSESDFVSDFVPLSSPQNHSVQVRRGFLSSSPNNHSIQVRGGFSGARGCSVRLRRVAFTTASQKAKQNPPTKPTKSDFRINAT